MNKPSLDYVRGFQDAREQVAEMALGIPPPFCGEYEDRSYYAGYRAALAHVAEAARVMQPAGQEERRQRDERVREFMRREAGYYVD